MKKSRIFNNKVVFIIAIVIVIVAFAVYRYSYKESQTIYEKAEEPPNYYIKNEYKANEYRNVTIELIDLLNEYLAYYLKLTTDNPEEAFELLTDDSKEKLKDITEYKKYLKDIKTVGTKKIIEYRFKNKTNKQIIEIVDNEGYKYTIYENAVWDFKISLDGRN